MSSTSIPSDRPILSRAELETFDSKPQGSGIEKRYRCPFCQSSERAFHVNLSTGVFNCKRASCHVAGQLSDFWKSRQEGDGPKGRALLSKRERARVGLAQAFSLSPDDAGGKPLGDKPPHTLSVAAEANQPLEIGLSTSPILPPLSEVTSPTTSPNTNSPSTTSPLTSNWQALWGSAVPINDTKARPGAHYLKERGLSLDVASAAGVRFCANWAPSAEGKSYRAGAAVLYPSTNESGEVVAVSGRYIVPVMGSDNKPIKARTGGIAKQGVFLAPALINGQWVLPFDRRLDAIIIVEGQADALALAVCGFPSLAAGGVNLAPWLHRRAGLRRVLLAPDNDKGGDEAAPLWEAYLSSYGARCERLVPQDAKDWNEILLNWGHEVLADWLFAVHSQ